MADLQGRSDTSTWLSRKHLLIGFAAGPWVLAAGSRPAGAQAPRPSGGEPKEKGPQASDTGHGLEAKAEMEAEAVGPAKQGDEQKAGGDERKPAPNQEKSSPEEKMARRFPQPVRVSYLVGLPMLDENSSTLGHVRHVVRKGAGKIRLVINYGGLFGIGERLIAVPVEVCAMLGRQLAALDMPRAEFEPAPTWYGSGDEAVGFDETIRVAIMRR